MQPIFEKISLKERESFSAHIAEHPYFITPLHYHPEVEIIYIDKSFGTRIVGNHIDAFTEGDLVMIGSNTPHVWRNDELFYKKSKRIARAYVLQFEENFLGERIFQLPEMVHLKKMFVDAKKGICFNGLAKKKIIELIFSIFKTKGQERIVLLINLLHFISQCNQKSFLMNEAYSDSYSKTDCDKISKVYEYLLKNYSTEIDFSFLANKMNLTLPSLCRFFKNRTHKNITNVLNEIRINHACKLLNDNHYSATQICYLVGYGNYSHFNEQFKIITGTTPLQYRKKFEK